MDVDPAFFASESNVEGGGVGTIIKDPLELGILDSVAQLVEHATFNR